MKSNHVDERHCKQEEKCVVLIRTGPLRQHLGSTKRLSLF